MTSPDSRVPTDWRIITAAHGVGRNQARERNAVALKFLFARRGRKMSCSFGLVRQQTRQTDQVEFLRGGRKKVLASKDVFRKNSNSEPWKLLVPDFGGQHTAGPARSSVFR